ncbi:MAG: Gfo/Idh/MocA family oxidoreductase [Isosphaeraceae bacterium]
MATITMPNSLHAEMTLAAAAAGKHVVCEKPLCMTLEEADAMIDACQRAGVLLMYAEEFFTPKYVKAKQMASRGAFGKVYLVKQHEKHRGCMPTGSGTTARRRRLSWMGWVSHGIAFCYWFLNRPRITSVRPTWARMCTRRRRAERMTASA